jgi:hypothetical protein
MKSARLILGNGGLGRSKAGLVYGNLALQIGDVYFPDALWNDFAVVVLTSWCQGIVRLLLGADSADIPFMDGPFSVNLSRVMGDVWRLSLIETAPKQRMCRQEEIDAEPLIQSALDASALILDKCREQKWWSAEADKLESAARAVRAIEQSLRGH